MYSFPEGSLDDATEFLNLLSCVDDGKVLDINMGDAVVVVVDVVVVLVVVLVDGEFSRGFIIGAGSSM